MGSNSTNSFFGAVHHQIFDQHSVGGSSGGSAVAVAAEKCDIALGTDTGGSVRLPAAYTGVVGFKPSYGWISRWGVVSYANSLDTVGILASSAHKARTLLQVVQGHDPRDPTTITPGTRKRLKRGRRDAALRHVSRTEFQKPVKEKFHKFRIGVPMEYNISELDPGIRQAWQNALKIFQDQGCTIVPVSLPNTRHALSAYYVLAPAEAASNLSKYDGIRYGTRNDAGDGAADVLYSKTRGEGFGGEVKRRILLGSYTLSSEAIDNYFIKAQKVRRLVQKDFDRVFSLPNLLQPEEQFNLSDMDESIVLENKVGPPQVDFIVCPTAPTRPPRLDDIAKQTPVDTYMNDVFTVPASMAGLPAVSIPFQITEEFQQVDIPQFAGIQIIGQYSDDHRVLETASILENLRGPVRPKLRYNHVVDSEFPSIRLEEVTPGRRIRQHGVSLPSLFHKVFRALQSFWNNFVGSNKNVSDDPRGLQIRKVKVEKRMYETHSRVKSAATKRLTKSKPRKGFGGSIVRKYVPRKAIIKKILVPALVKKHLTGKGDDPFRKPKSPKELDAVINDSFEWWGQLSHEKGGSEVCRKDITTGERGNRGNKEDDSEITRKHTNARETENRGQKEGYSEP
jgi:aspartyl-tRNA(Asn)/glutamyl-tRNA(Gln) amidotransferase subunit A